MPEAAIVKRPSADGERRVLPFRTTEVRVCLVGHGRGVWEIAQVLAQRHVTLAGLITSVNEEAQRRDPSVEYLKRHGLYRSVRETAEMLQVPLLEVEDPNDAVVLRRIKEELRGNLVISFSAPLFRQHFLDTMNGCVFNLHGSARSPLYRGRGGPSWMILNGVTQGTVLFHWVDAGVDTGPLVLRHDISWHAQAYPVDIMRATMESAGPIIHTFVDFLETGSLPAISQQRLEARYFPALETQKDGVINWDWPAAQIERFIRAFGWPYAGAAGDYRSRSGETRTVQIARASVADDTEAPYHPFCHGVVSRYAEGGAVDVICGDGTIRLHSLRDGLEEIEANRIVRLGGRFVNRGSR